MLDCFLCYREHFIMPRIRIKRAIVGVCVSVLAGFIASTMFLTYAFNATKVKSGDKQSGLVNNVFIRNEHDSTSQKKHHLFETTTVQYTISKVPVIYVVTPSGKRLEQKADLTRLSHTLRLVPNLHWILVEDNNSKSGMIAELLKRSTLSYTHLNIPTPPEMVNKTHPNAYSRGVEQRNGGISWIRKYAEYPGVVYFADDDNTYTLQIFEEMRHTRKVSVWPVGLVASQRYESPIVFNGKVTGWFTVVQPRRKFATDMAGFAVNIRLLADNPTAKFRNKKYNIETDFLFQFHISISDLEPMADNCTKVLVWHTRTRPSSLANEKALEQKYGHGTDTEIEV